MTSEEKDPRLLIRRPTDVLAPSREHSLAPRSSSLRTAALATLLRRSPFYVFASFRTPQEWHACGLTAIHPVAKLRVKTTGNEGYTITVYINMRLAPA